MKNICPSCDSVTLSYFLNLFNTKRKRIEQNCTVAPLEGKVHITQEEFQVNL